MTLFMVQTTRWKNLIEKVSSILVDLWITAFGSRSFAVWDAAQIAHLTVQFPFAFITLVEWKGQISKGSSCIWPKHATTKLPILELDRKRSSWSCCQCSTQSCRHQIELSCKLRISSSRSGSIVTWCRTRILSNQTTHLIFWSQTQLQMNCANWLKFTRCKSIEMRGTHLGTLESCLVTHDHKVAHSGTAWKKACMVVLVATVWHNLTCVKLNWAAKSVSPATELEALKAEILRIRIASLGIISLVDPSLLPRLVLCNLLEFLFASEIFSPFLFSLLGASACDDDPF